MQTPLLLVVHEPWVGELGPVGSRQRTVTPTWGEPSGLDARAVIVAAVLPTLADWVEGESVSGGVCCVILAVPDAPVSPSVAVSVQVPPVIDEVYVVEAWPLASVVPEVGLTLPQAPAGLALPSENVTGSFGTAVPVLSFTVAVNICVLLPSGATVALLGLTVTLKGTGWVAAGPK